MKKVKKVYYWFIISLFSFRFLLSQAIPSTTLFESPTAKFPVENIYWEGGMTFSTALKSYEESIEPHPSDFDIFGYASFFKRYIVGLKIYTLNEISADFAYLIMDEIGNYPALAVGMRNISYKRYINPAGGEPPEGGFRDENYRGKFRRNPEIFSLYLVATKTFRNRFEISLGLGRGEFVGYGPRSKYLNIDHYLNSYHDLSFGFFGGAKINILSYLSLVGEIDGRDLNIGLKFHGSGFDLALAFTKLEGIIFTKEEEKPFSRFTGAFTLNSNIIPSKPLLVYITFYVYDKEVKEPLKDVIINFPNTNLPSLKTDEKGFASCELVPGIYMVEIALPEYKTLKVKLDVKKEKKRMRIETPLILEVPRKERAFNYIKLARENIEKENFYEAKKNYEQAKSIYPSYPGLSEEYSHFINLYQEKINSARSFALSYESKGDLQNAIKAWQEVLRLDPENKEADTRIKALSEEIARKKVVPEKKPVKAPSKPAYTQAQIQKMLDQAIAEYEKANYQKAKELLQKVLEADPGNAKAKEYLTKTEKRLKLLGK